MKRAFKTALSLLLSFTLVFSVVTVSFADTGCDCGEEPIVYVAALGSATLYQSTGSGDEKVIFRPENETYVKLVLKLLIPLVSLIVTGNYDAFGDSLIDAASEVFAPLANQDNGLSTADIITKRTLPTDPAHGLDKSYYFGYDFRADPAVTAEQLNTFIEHVKQLTGHSQVRLRASSMGGVMTMTYLRIYGSDSVKSVIFQNCPLLGTAVAGDMFCGRLEINAYALYRYGDRALPSLLEDPWTDIVDLLLRVLYKSGVLDYLVGIADKAVEQLGDRVFDELLIPVFKANCGIWSFVPDADYDEAKAFMLGDNPDEELVRRIDFYHYEVQGKAKEILNGLIAKGIPVMIVSGTNMQRTPLVKSYNNDSDGTVDTMYSSVGAKVALLECTLPAGHTQIVNCGHNHLSPDNRIDASTCALPEQTWFVNDMLHSTTHDGHTALYRWFYTSDDAVQTVFSNPDYPQFLQNDIKNERLLPQ